MPHGGTEGGRKEHIKEDNNRVYAVTNAPLFSPASSLGFSLCLSLTITFLPLGYDSRYKA